MMNFFGEEKTKNEYHETSLKDVKANMINKKISLRGTIIRTSSVRNRITQMCFKCCTCSSTFTEVIEDGKFSLPKKCSGQLHEGCKGKKFSPERSSDETISIDYQVLRLQEKLVDEELCGRIPRTIDCEVTGELVDVVIPGDVLTVNGTVKYSEASETNVSSSLNILYIQVDSIYSNTSSLGERQMSSTDKVSVEFSEQDFKDIREVYQRANLFNLLINSLCPSIFGHEMVKCGLLLGLFSGSNGSKGNSLSVRANSHILVVGDPGMGKSQMLGAVSFVAPRGVYVCSNTATSSGLTVTLTKEKGSNEYQLEAGALAMADLGVCCIDEFDKLTEHDALLETMEQQTISIAKAGVCCSLPARTSVIAAANPIGGHYNPNKTIAQNLSRLNPALLSRFDIIFILLDRPNEKMDSFLAKHVMNLHSGGFNNMNLDNEDVEESDTFFKRIKCGSKDSFEAIPSSVLRKYIAYAKKFINPKLSIEAAALLQDYYLHIRKTFTSMDSLPVTTRQLESMIRLSIARAKAELREVVTREDAMDVIEILNYSLFGLMKKTSNNHSNKRPSSKREEVQTFIECLRNFPDREINSADLKELHQNLELKIPMHELLSKINHEGILLQKGNGIYKITL